MPKFSRYETIEANSAEAVAADSFACAFASAWVASPVRASESSPYSEPSVDSRSAIVADAWVPSSLLNVDASALCWVN